MNPSRPFILRPVATVAADGGARCWPASSPTGSCRSRRCRRSTIRPSRSSTFYPGREPRRHGLLGHRAARAPVRPDAGPEPDDLDQLVRQLGHHAAVRPRPQHRRRRAGGAGGDQRGRRPSCRATCRTRRSTARSTRPTRRSSRWRSPRSTLPLSEVEDLADTRLAQKISQLPGVGLVSISGGQKPAVRVQANPTRARRLRPRARGPAHGARARPT